MRFNLIAAAAPLLCAIQFGCQSTSPSNSGAAARPAPPEARGGGESTLGMVATMYVKGMSCPLCANNIDQQLMRVPGVEHVSVNLGSGEVRAMLDPKRPPTRDQLANAIENSGFTLDRIESPTP